MFSYCALLKTSLCDLGRLFKKLFINCYYWNYYEFNYYFSNCIEGIHFWGSKALDYCLKVLELSERSQFHPKIIWGFMGNIVMEETERLVLNYALTENCLISTVTWFVHSLPMRKRSQQIPRLWSKQRAKTYTIWFCKCSWCSIKA